jgi:CheY-like chemotaxis protein
MPHITTFLLVEDDLNDVFFAEQAFKEAPPHLRLEHVADGTEAVQYLKGEGAYADRERHPLPHVILLDLKMPGMNGFDFLSWLRSKSPGDVRLLPVIVMSSSAFPEDVKRAYELGVSAYMTKPIDFQDFKERIKLLGIFWGKHAETPLLNAL